MYNENLTASSSIDRNIFEQKHQNLLVTLPENHWKSQKYVLLRWWCILMKNSTWTCQFEFAKEGKKDELNDDLMTFPKNGTYNKGVIELEPYICTTDRSANFCVCVCVFFKFDSFSPHFLLYVTLNVCVYCM